MKEGRGRDGGGGEESRGGDYGGAELLVCRIPSPHSAPNTAGCGDAYAALSVFCSCVQTFLLLDMQYGLLLLSLEVHVKNQAFKRPGLA